MPEVMIDILLQFGLLMMASGLLGLVYVVARVMLTPQTANHQQADVCGGATILGIVTLLVTVWGFV